MQAEQAPLYHNAIEPIVVKEVQRQLHLLPTYLVSYINPAQVIAYALNQLPSLYATSERGWQLQQQRIQTQLHTQIVAAVRQGIAAVQRDPLRVVTPLERSDVSPLKMRGGEV